MKEQSNNQTYSLHRICLRLYNERSTVVDLFLDGRTRQTLTLFEKETFYLPRSPLMGLVKISSSNGPHNAGDSQKFSWNNIRKTEFYPRRVKNLMVAMGP